jgi:hypothetical protein
MARDPCKPQPNKNAFYFNALTIPESPVRQFLPGSTCRPGSPRQFRFGV